MPKKYYIDTLIFTAHSFGSATSSAKKINKFSKSQDHDNRGMKSAETFRKFYDKHKIVNNVGFQNCDE